MENKATMLTCKDADCRKPFKKKADWYNQKYCCRQCQQKNAFRRWYLNTRKAK